ncbi:hypothetical protein MY1884_001485 [Beauveria asiatica]
MTTELPSRVSGGCLCKGIRYTITFPKDDARDVQGGACGDLVYWAADGEDEMSVCVGTLDGDALQRYGKVLTYAERHLFCVNEIPGVTDHLPGTKHEQGD